MKLHRRDFLKRFALAGAGFLFARSIMGKEGFSMGKEKMSLSYGDNPLLIDMPEGQLEVLGPNPYPPLRDVDAAIFEALQKPIGSPPLADRVRPGAKVAIVIADRTRLFPQKRMINQLLNYLQGQAKVRPQDIAFVVGNANHAVDPLEMLGLGDEILGKYRFVNFDSTRYADMKRLGHTKPMDPDFLGQALARAWTRGSANVGGSLMAALGSAMRLDLRGAERALHGGPALETGLAWYAAQGTDVWVDKTVSEADLVIGLGQIKPHPLTGFSGGAKAIAPGVYGRKSIIANHLLQAHSSVGVGRVQDNILRLDLEKGCAMLPNVFILNVVMNGDKQPAAFVAGDAVAAHRAGVAVAEKICKVAPRKADIVIYSNKAQGKMNLYQFIKSMPIGAAIVKPGGVIIAAADLPDGVGRRMKINPSFAVKEVYYHYNYAYRMPAGVDIILVCSNVSQVARGSFFRPAPSVEAALSWAKAKIGPQATVCVIPDTDMVLPRFGG